jgi:dGTPase
MTDLDRHKLIRRLVGILVSNVAKNTDDDIRKSKVRSVRNLQELDHNVVSYSQDMQRRNRELKDFLYSQLYRHYRVIRMAVKAETVLTELYTAFTDEPGILPRGVQDQAEQRGLERAICDYIAGMTDRYAIEEHQRLYDPLRLP